MLNKAIIMGRLTATPELRRTGNDTAVTSFTLAVNRSYAKQGEERQTDFIDCVAWRNNAEFVSKYFSKGQLVAVCGSLQTRNWTDNNGANRKAVEIVVDEVHFAEPKRDGARSDTPGFNPPAMTGGNTTDFEVTDLDDDEELPF